MKVWWLGVRLVKGWYFIVFLQLSKIVEQDGLDLRIDRLKPAK
jgi:hypothetical protein